MNNYLQANWNKNMLVRINLIKFIKRLNKELF